MTAADADLLLDWANDPATRAASFHPDPIDRDTHIRWLADRLASPTTRLMIGLVDGEPVGQVRLERDPAGDAEIGIAIAPGQRGQGLGAGLLAAAVTSGRTDPALDVGRFVARVRPGNAPSVQLFEGAGFHLAGRDEVAGVPCLIYELPA